MEYTIFYNSADATGESILSKALAQIKYPDATILDIAGIDSAAIDVLVAAIVPGSQTKIIITVPIVDVHATGKFTGVQAFGCIVGLTTANQAASSNLTGTCQANATVTDIILAATETSANDALNNKLIVTAGVTEVTRLITDYTLADDTAVVATTGTAITTTETYTVYMTTHLVLGADYDTVLNGPQVTWNALYPYQKQNPIIIDILANPSTLYEKNDLTATGVGTAYLEDATEFVAAAYDGGNYYLAITNGSTAGEVRRILSNTVTKLTLVSDFDVPLTGTPTYQIVKDNSLTLWNKYLPHAIAGWLHLDTVATKEAWRKILDQHSDLTGESSIHRTFFQDLATLEDYLAKGKAVFEGIAAGIVS